MQDHVHEKQNPPVHWGQGELTFSGPCLRRADSYQRSLLPWAGGQGVWREKQQHESCVE